MVFLSRKQAASPRRWLTFVASIPFLAMLAGVAQAQINALTVDCTPFVSPNFTSFGPDNTMGMSLQQVDLGGNFNVTEVTPAAFRAMTAGQLASYDLIAINNNPSRIDCGSGLGLGTTWHSVIGVQQGGRIVLNSHDAARFKVIIPPGGAFFGFGAPGPGVEPFGADEIIRQAALWAGGGSQTGLLIFNDSARFFTVGGQGWDNPELNLPAAWMISDLNQTGGAPTDGGYTDILPAFQTHPIYTGLSDARFGIDSLSSFAANIADGSFHSVFGSFNPGVFTVTEVVVNAGVIDVGGFNATFGIGANAAAAGPDGAAITLIRDEIIYVPVDVKPQSCRNPLNGKANGVLPVAVLGTAVFDASGIDPATVRLEGVAPLRWSMEDVATPFEPYTGKEDAFDCTDMGPDGFMDLTLKFDTQEIVNAVGAVAEGQVLVLTLTGSLTNGMSFQGEDVVVVVKTKN